MKVCTGVVFLDILRLCLTTGFHQVFKNQVCHHLFFVHPYIVLIKGWILQNKMLSISSETEKRFSVLKSCPPPAQN